MSIYTTSEEIILGKVSNVLKSKFTDVNGEKLIETEERFGHLFNFLVQPAERCLLNSLGVYISPLAHQHHSHPVNKLLENHFLYVLARPFLNSKTVFMSIKPTKIRKVMQLSNFSTPRVINRLIEVKDILRYGEAVSTPDKLVYRCPEGSDDFLRVKDFSGPSQNFFIHDEVHHWNVDTMVDFLSVVKPNTLLCTMVFPPEILDGWQVSANPSMYNFRIGNNGTFQYFPDGVHSESYTQILDGGFLLKAGRIICCDSLSYTVDVVKTIGAHHLILIAKGNFLKTQERTFGNFECVDFREIEGRFRLKNFEGIRFEVLKKIIFYCFSLKRLETESAIAKLRQLDSEDLRLNELFFVRKLISKIVELGIGKIKPDEGVIRSALISLLPRKFIEVTRLTTEGNSLYNFLQKMRCLNFSVKVRTFYKGSETLLGILEHMFEESGEDDVDFKEGKSLCTNQPFKPLGNGLSVILEPGPYTIGSSYSFVGHDLIDGNLFSAGRIDLGVKLRAKSGVGYNHLKPSCRVFLLPACQNSSKLKYDKGCDNDESEVHEDVIISTSPIGFEMITTSSRTWNLFGAVVAVGDFFTEAGEDYCLHSSGLPMLLEVGNRTIKNFWDPSRKDLSNLHVLFIRLQSRGDELEVPSELFAFISSNFRVQKIHGSAIICEYGEYCDSQKSVGSLDFEDALIPRLAENPSKMKIVSLANNTLLAFEFDGVFLENRGVSIFQESERQIKILEHNDCLINSICLACDLPLADCLTVLKERAFNIYVKYMSNKKLETCEIEPILKVLGVKVRVKLEEEEFIIGDDKAAPRGLSINISDGHAELDQNPPSIHFVDQKRRNRMDVSKLALYSPSYSRNNYYIDLKAAEIIHSAFSSGSYCVLKEKFRRRNFMNLESHIKGIKSYNFSLVSVLGFAGSGKSYGVKSFIKEQEQRALIISPRSLLANEWNKGLKDTVSLAVTYENLFTQDLKKFSIFVFDEVDLFPPGYLDLAFVFLHRGKVLNDNVIVLGDPLQCKFYSDEDRFGLNSVQRFTNKLKGAKYLFESRRSEKWIENVFGVKSLRSENDLSDHSCAVLCPSQESKATFMAMKNSEQPDVFSDFGDKDKNIHTYGEVQGLTFKKVNIFINQESVLNSKENLICAFTRPVQMPGIFGDINGLDMSTNLFLKELLVSGKYDLTKVVDDLGFERVNSKAIGNIAYDKCRVDLDLHAYADLLDYIRVEDIPAEEVEVLEAVTRTSYPISPKDFQNVSLLTHLVAKEMREKVINIGFGKFFHKDLTNQFTETIRKVSDTLSDPDNFSSIFPRHTNSDRATFKMAVKKRLRFRTFLQNSEILDSKMSMGKELCNFFVNKLKINERVDGFLEESHNDFLSSVCKKDEATMIRNSSRSDPDWDYNEIFLFMKTQFCKKSEKMFSEATAGQTISCFSHRVLFDFSKFCRATEKVLIRALPSHWYVHNRRDFKDLNAFTKKFFKGEMCVENDYSAFDASQDHLILAFELFFLKHIGWPDSLVECYKNLKLNLKCSIGSLSVMRFTGEFCTFLFNTICNILLCLLKYGNLLDTPVLFAGDDMASLGNLQEIGDNKDFLEAISVVGKTFRTAKPSFCGWFLTKDGIFKNPELLMSRCLLNLENCKLSEIIDNYFIEFSYSLLMGDLIHKHLNEKEEFCQSDLLVFFTKHKNLLKGFSAELFRDLIMLR